MKALQTETLLKADNKQEAESVIELINEFTVEQKEKMLVFMQGVKFANNLLKREVE